MLRQYKGSMTVEAAVVVPIVIFVVTAVIDLCFFLHDRVVLQSYGLRKTEAIVWDNENTADPPVFMVQYQSEKTQNQWVTGVVDLLKSRRHANVSVSGSMQTRGSETVTGGLWKMEKRMGAVRVNYVQDRLVTNMMRKEK